MQKITVRELLDANRAALDGKGDLILLAKTDDLIDDDPDYGTGNPYRSDLAYFDQVKGKIGCAIGVCMTLDTKSRMHEDGSDVVQSCLINEIVKQEFLGIDESDLPIFFLTQTIHDAWHERQTVEGMKRGQDYESFLDKLPTELRHFVMDNQLRIADELMYRNWLNRVEEHLSSQKHSCGCGGCG